MHRKTFYTLTPPDAELKASRFNRHTVAKLKNLVKVCAYIACQRKFIHRDDNDFCSTTCRQNHSRMSGNNSELKQFNTGATSPR